VSPTLNALDTGQGTDTVEFWYLFQEGLREQLLFRLIDSDEVEVFLAY
jgi:hypothetical protein